MTTRIIKAEAVTKAVKNLLIDCNYNIGDDVMHSLSSALENETSPTGQDVLQQLIENNKIAKNEKLPICQDTGMAILFVEYGDKVCIDGDFEYAVNLGVSQAYTEGYLRKSVVDDPVFDRKNTNDNTPAIIHTKIVNGDKIKIVAGAKGFGSENMSAVFMLAPAKGVDGVKEAVLTAVKNAGPNPCPPMIIGVGIGGTFEKAAQLAKKATFREINSKNCDKRYADLEDELLNEINKLGIGPAGLGGNTTALKVNIETFPTHIASIPVAVNICCHAARHKSIII